MIDDRQIGVSLINGTIEAHSAQTLTTIRLRSGYCTSKFQSLDGSQLIIVLRTAQDYQPYASRRLFAHSRLHIRCERKANIDQLTTNKKQKTKTICYDKHQSNLCKVLANANRLRDSRRLPNGYPYNYSLKDKRIYKRQFNCSLIIVLQELISWVGRNSFPGQVGTHFLGRQETRTIR